MDAERVLREKLLLFATSKRYDEEVARAFEMFWGGRRKLAGTRLNEADSARFLEWYIFDYRTKGHGKRPVELFEEFRGYTLPDEQRELLRQWQCTRFGLYEVTAVRGAQLGLRDVLDNDSLTVQSPEGCPLAKGDLVFARVMDVGRTLRISGTVTRIPGSAKEAVTQHLSTLFDEYSRGLPNARWRDFFREHGHRVNHFLTDLCEGRCT
jgi:hypothetical protein